MAKAKNKARLPVKALAEFDPQTKYGNKAVVIEGIVSPESQCSWQATREGYHKHCFTLAAWRMSDGPLLKQDLYIQRPIRRPHDWPRGFLKHTVHRMEVVLSHDQTRAVFSRRLRMTKPNTIFGDVFLQLIRPVVLSTDELGDFTLDRSINWFEGKARWKGKDVNVTLPGPTAVFLEDDFELPVLELPFQTLLKVLRAQKKWDRNCKHRATKELLAIKNKHWLNEGEAPLYATEFAARMQLTSISMEADGRIEFWYEVDEMFTDHGIRVSATLKDGPTDAGIEG